MVPGGDWEEVVGSAVNVHIMASVTGPSHQRVVRCVHSGLPAAPVWLAQFPVVLTVLTT